ncbi:OmpH family outer membrane protein [Rhodocaloribacter litoris]|uniref:OmpH family outer membrane protein n=1 Tax=Rhodocaloribacter litoris TaxID=2558931 RepID=UPI0014248031|nr:OmpH family outer membrane protein [Rhodocaloribacter litoris]QXD16300.1 OmpH family outer membrane protein [Rhodocaloribacter litoris]GIV60879.1 MAG: membrane protein [Rhodothermaceae bacterium]
MKRASYFALILGACLGFGIPAAEAQQRIGYVDSDYILEQVPEYRTIQNQVDRLTQEWEAELKQKQEEVEALFREYQARELLYTNEERKRKQEEIMRAEEEVERLRMRYFGPDGELFQQQEQLMRPLQERILAAIEQVATREGYDYVFDRAGDFIFLFAREQYNLSDRVLEELGIDTAGRGGS